MTPNEPTRKDHTIAHGKADFASEGNARLVVVHGENPTMRYDLAEEETTLGRHVHCSFVLQSDMVSRRHAKVVREGVNYFVEDLNSFNGTLVNGRRMETGQRQQLRDKDVIQISNFRLMFLRADTDDAVAFTSIHLDQERIKEEAEQAIRDWLKN